MVVFFFMHAIRDWWSTELKQEKHNFFSLLNCTHLFISIALKIVALVNWVFSDATRQVLAMGEA